MIVFCGLAGAVWINIIPELLKTHVLALRQVKSDSMQDLQLLATEMLLQGLLFGWNPRHQHQAPAPRMRKDKSHKRDIPSHTSVHPQ